MTTITVEQEQSIRAFLAAMPTLAVGVGTKEQACSVAALNLALSGTLTDKVPDCMSALIGRWIIGVQDPMPATIRNSAAWRELLVLAAGTGREHEAERSALVLSWMRGCLSQAAEAAEAADADAYAYAAQAAEAAEAADAYAVAAAAAYAVAAVDTYAYAYAYAYADFRPAVARATSVAWATFDPVGLLRRLVAVTDERALAVGDG